MNWDENGELGIQVQDGLEKKTVDATHREDKAVTG